ncbi:MAG: DNA polymerase III subunit beta [Fusobacteriaceae bacterium]
MEVKVSRLEFLRCLKIVEKAISENKIKPIISCVFVEAEDNKLKFYGTNLELTIVTTLSVNLQGSGQFVFQHQIVEEYLRELKAEDINLKIENSVLTISTEDSSTAFALQDHSEFPKTYLSNELQDGTFSFAIKKSEIVEAYEKTKFAASQSTDDMRINCIKMDVENKMIKFVGTDTYRLVYLEKEIDSDGKYSISIPLNSVDGITKLMKSLDVDEDIRISIGTKNVKFEIADITIISRLIDLPYPDYKGILRNLNYDKKLTLKNQDFATILKRVMIFVKNNSDSRYGAIFELGDNKLAITGNSELAKINEALSVKFEGSPIKISLNTKFLHEFLLNLPQTENIFIEFINANGSIRVAQENEDKYLYIVMPLALRDV